MHYISYYFYEIRLRFAYICIASICSFLASYHYKYELFYMYSKPFFALSTHFFFFDITEGFYTFLRVSVISTLLSTLPLLVYHVWSFCLPSWYNYQRKLRTHIVQCVAIIFVLEFFFMYCFLFPKLCEFFASFQFISLECSRLDITFSPRIASYINSMMHFFLVFLIIGQFPLVFIEVFRQKMCTSDDLCEYRKVVFFCCIFLAALVSPPDFLSQLCISCVFYMIYEIIIIMGYFWYSVEFP